MTVGGIPPCSCPKFESHPNPLLLMGPPFKQIRNSLSLNLGRLIYYFLFLQQLLVDVDRNDEKGFAKKELKTFFFPPREREGNKITFSMDFFPTQTLV